MSTIPHISHSFIVRVWADEIVAAEPHWRGLVVDVATSERHYFHSFTALSDYLTHVLTHRYNAACSATAVPPHGPI